ncbi:hypothetical protein Tco_1045468 [Tanacetum coccineum]|uniref:Uncharacterized protein n=1 Tax=Tanacetum coccineum TaxID=301880 RepID=A0ABQ5GVC3_9ASTR
MIIRKASTITLNTFNFRIRIKLGMLHISSSFGDKQHSLALVSLRKLDLRISFSVMVGRTVHLCDNVNLGSVRVQVSVLPVCVTHVFVVEALGRPCAVVERIVAIEA